MTHADIGCSLALFGLTGTALALEKRAISPGVLAQDKVLEFAVLIHEECVSRAVLPMRIGCLVQTMTR